VIDLTPNALENALLSMWNAIDESGERIAVRPTRLLVPRKMLRKAIFIMYCKHKAHLMPFKQRKATRRAKARQHASFMTPRWAI
jgi:phage major head subunit gpT-like protein